MPFGIIGRTGPGMRQVVGFGDRFTGRGTFGGEFWGAPLQPMGNLRRTCATVPQPSELLFAVVRAMGRGIAVLDGRSTSCKGNRTFGVYVPHFHNGKCHWDIGVAASGAS